MNIYTVTDFDGVVYVDVAADSPEAAARDVESRYGVTSVLVEDACGAC